jgi:two-component system cell cycle response regulator
MADDRTERYLDSLATYVGALEAARKGLPAEAPAESIRRLAATLGRSSARHGFPAIRAAAEAITGVSDGELSEAADRLVTALLDTLATLTHRQRTVLLLDDDVVLARLYQRVLERAGRQVRVAINATEMLDVLRTEWVDLVILDLGLPDLDGREVLAALKANPDTAPIPVLVVTAAESPWLEAECRALGADRFLPKPVDPVLLADSVADLLAPKQPLPPDPRPRPVPEGPSRPEPVQAGPTEPREVLLAEHDALTSQIIKHRLGREGLVVRHFTSGTAALQAAASLTPAAAILDALTPGIDGIELVARLRQLDHYRTLPILILTDIGSEREVVRALEAGADDCIRKPFSPTELVARVERLLARR